jgi:hypothetical protein
VDFRAVLTVGALGHEGWRHAQVPQRGCTCPGSLESAERALETPASRGDAGAPNGTSGPTVWAIAKVERGAPRAASIGPTPRRLTTAGRLSGEGFECDDQVERRRVGLPRCGVFSVSFVVEHGTVELFPHGLF